MIPFEPVWIFPGMQVAFPDPRLADGEGLVAIGGDLSVARLREAYSHGIFPWFDEDTPPLWWSPDPRCIVEPASFHVPKRLRRTLRAGGFTVSWDRAFRDVMLACRERRRDGVWILDSMIEAYVALHEAGTAHSFEVWRDSELVGGLYGVHIGGLFAAESMFHRERDMSKVALAVAVTQLFGAGIELFDVQFLTEHLRQFGAVEITRADYLTRLSRAVEQPRSFCGDQSPEFLW